jgi:hypothetical protein
LADSDQNEPIDGATDRQDGLIADALPRGTEQAIARATQLFDQRVAVAQEKEQRKQRERQRDKPAEHVAADQARQR